MAARRGDMPRADHGANLAGRDVDGEQRVGRRARRVSDEISFSVPVVAGDRLVAALTIRSASTASPEVQAAQRFVPRLRATADRIGEEFVAQAEQDARVAAGQPAARIRTAV